METGDDAGGGSITVWVVVVTGGVELFSVMGGSFRGAPSEEEEEEEESDLSLLEECDRDSRDVNESRGLPELLDVEDTEEAGDDDAEGGEEDDEELM